MIEGVICIYKAAIVILNTLKKDIENEEFEDILKALQNIINLKTDYNIFMDNMRNVKFTDNILYKISLLNDEYIPME